MLSSVNFADVTVIADLEAGIGTLTRLGEGQVDAVLLVVEHTAKSLEVARRAAELAREKSLGRLVVVANRVREQPDLDAIAEAFPGAEIVRVPLDAAIVDADRNGAAPIDTAPDAPAVRALAELGESLAAGLVSAGR